MNKPMGDQDTSNVKSPLDSLTKGNPKGLDLPKGGTPVVIGRYDGSEKDATSTFPSTVGDVPVVGPVPTK